MFPTQIGILITLAILNVLAVLQLWEIQPTLGATSELHTSPAVFIPYMIEIPKITSACGKPMQR